MSQFLQFGTSRFLQAHADLFIDQALGADQICVVQTSGDAGRRARLSALAAPEGYVVRVRGLMDGDVVDEQMRVRSVACAISASEDWASVLAAGLTCRYILSNVSEKGYVASPFDAENAFDARMSFVAKLCILLFHRFSAGRPPLTIMPLELLERNGTYLQSRIFDCAETRALPTAFLDWLGECIWVNSIVDRIVSEPIDPAGAVAEPYALWAVEKQAGLAFPFVHPAVQLMDDLAQAQVLKLYILNLSHTYIADMWQRHQLDKQMSVRAYLDDETRLNDLMSMLDDEVVPAFAMAGLTAVAEPYVLTTLSRFKNPYLDHFIKDIFAGHAQKIETRIGGFLAWARANGDSTEKPKLGTVTNTK